MIRSQNRRYKNASLRRTANIGPGGENQVTRRTPLVPTLTDVDVATLTVDFDSPIVVSGVPAIIDNGKATTHTTTIETLSPTSVAITFNAAPTGPLQWPFEDPGIRNAAGGYVQPGVYALPS